jgi:hypothetical protein
MLVVGVISELRERESVPCLGLGCGVRDLTRVYSMIDRVSCGFLNIPSFLPFYSSKESEGIHVLML